MRYVVVQCVASFLSPVPSLLFAGHGPGAMGRPPLPPGQDKRSRKLASNRAYKAKVRARNQGRPTLPTNYTRKYRLNKVIGVASSQESCASSVSTTGSSASSSTLSDRSLRRRARTALDAIITLGTKGERQLLSRSEMIGVLDRNGWTPPRAACGENDMEVEVEGDDTCVGQPPTVPTCCISVMDEFLCSQQISDMSPFKKHQVSKR